MGLLACLGVLAAAAAAQGQIPSLPSPELLSPVDGAVLPSTATAARLAWTPVPGAVSYALRVQDLTAAYLRDRRHHHCLEGPELCLRQ